MEQEKTTMIFRIENNLKKAFERIAAEKDLTTSQMLRSFIRETVSNQANKSAQRDLFKPETSTGKKKQKVNSAKAILAQCKKGV